MDSSTTGIIAAIVAGAPIISGGMIWVVNGIGGYRAPATEETIRQINTHIGRIVEYVDGLPRARRKIKDPFSEGMAHKESHRYDEAITLFRQALAQGPTGSQRAALLGLIGNCFFQQARASEAEPHYKEAETAAREAGDQKALATTYNNMANVYRFQRYDDQALEWYHKSLKITEKIGNLAALDATYNNIGMVYYRRRDYEQALEWYHKSLKITEEIGDRATLAEAYLFVASAYRFRGDYDQALEWYHKSLKITEEIGDRATIAETYGMIGAVYEFRRDYDQALEWYHKSVKVEEGLGNRANLAFAYDTLGRVYESRGDSDQAVQWRQKGHSIFDQMEAEARARRVKKNTENP